MRNAFAALALSLFAACATTTALAPDPAEPQAAWGAPTGREPVEQTFGSRLQPGDSGPDHAALRGWSAANANSCAFNSQCGFGSCSFGTCSPFPPGR